MRTAAIFPFVLALCVGCAKTPTVSEDQAVESTQAAETVERSAPVEASEGKMLIRPTQPIVVDDPVKAYEECKTRVEGVSTEGECAADTDCVATGCSKELCVSKVAAADGLVSPCEVLPCFAVLDTCGCQEGACVWSVKGAE